MAALNNKHGHDEGGRMPQAAQGRTNS